MNISAASKVSFLAIMALASIKATLPKMAQRQKKVFKFILKAVLQLLGLFLILDYQSVKKSGASNFELGSGLNERRAFDQTKVHIFRGQPKKVKISNIFSFLKSSKTSHDFGKIVYFHLFHIFSFH